MDKKEEECFFQEEGEETIRIPFTEKMRKSLKSLGKDIKGLRAFSKKTQAWRNSLSTNDGSRLRG